MPSIVGLDTSLTATGFCRINVAQETGMYWTDCLTIHAPPPGDDKSKLAMARRVNTLISRIEMNLTREPVDLIVVEALAFAARGASSWVLPWVYGRVLELAVKHSYPLVTVATSARARYAAGTGKAGKDTVMLAAHKLWPSADVKNNNEADATILAAIGCHYSGIPICPETTYRKEVLNKVMH